MDSWQSQPIQIASTVFVDVKANAEKVVLAQGNTVWFHDLHLDPDDAIAIAVALQDGAIQCRAMRTQR
jgi:hypothetical protein